MEQSTYIYELYDPRTPEISYYVGVSNDPARRLREHICEPRHFNPGKYDWIRRLLDAGACPSIRIIDEVLLTDWVEAEKKWIATKRLEFLGLLNISSGGRGGSWMFGKKRPPFTVEHRRKLKEARKKRAPASEETKRKMSEAGRKRVFTEEHKRNISKAKLGKSRPPMSDEQKKKISEAGRGRKHTPEARAKMSTARKAAHRRGAYKR